MHPDGNVVHSHCGLPTVQALCNTLVCTCVLVLMPREQLVTHLGNVLISVKISDGSFSMDGIGYGRSQGHRGGQPDAADRA